MFSAKSIMCEEIISVKKDTHIYDAMRLLLEKKVSGLPVVDKNRNLEGVISEKDMLNLLMEKNVLDKETVEDYMSEAVISFAPEDSAIDICELFMKRPIRRVPIVEKGKLVGIVSRRDIIALILKVRGQDE